MEPQAYKEADFARCMFIYFSRLYEKHQKKVLPIAVFSHDSKAEEPNKHEVAFPFLKVLQFNFYKVQLKKLPWRQYISSSNPVAAALLSKMDYSPRERRQIKIEFLRMLTRMQLDPAKLGLITAIFDIYLGLSPEEEKEVEEKIKTLSLEELDELAEKIFDVASESDLKKLLSVEH